MIGMQHVLWAIANALWQSAAIAAIVGAGLRFTPRTTAAQRYALWCAVLVAAALLPVANLAMPSRTIALPVQAPPPAPVVTRVVDQVSRVVSSPLDAKTIDVPARHATRSVPSPLLILWAVIAAGLLLRLAVAYASLRGVKSSLVADETLTARVTAFNGLWSRHAVVGVSSRVAEPCAIGFLHPAIALSSEMAATLPDHDLERVLRHEYAHVRRYDDYANLFQRLVAVVFWFNPVVHIAGRAMAIEREIACDDAAAAASDERVAFARCLYEIARSAPRRRHAAAAGFIGTRRQIATRVARLVERNHNASTRLGSFAKITAITVLAVSLALAGVHLTALAVPQSAPLPQIAASPEPQIARPVDRAEPAPTAAPKARPAKVPAKTAVKAQAKTTGTIHAPVAERVEQRFAFAFAASDAPTPMANPTRSPLGPFATLRPFAPRMRSHTPRASGDDLMDALANAGFHDLSPDDLIKLADHGVQPQLITQLHAFGLTPMPADSLVRLADAGVGAAYIGGLAQLGYGSLSADDYVRLRNAGVTLEFVRHLQRSGLVKGRLSVDDLIKLANSGI